MKKAFFLVTLIMLLLLPVVGWATTYTVCSSGCDYTDIQAAFDGEDLGPNDKIRVLASTPGGTAEFDKVVWRSNDVGDATGYVTLEGREGDTIIINVINELTGWDESSNWTDNGNNIWSMSYSPRPGRLYLDGDEAILATSSTTVNFTYKWYYDTGSSTLYVYATQNPADEYSSMKGSSSSYALYAEARQYIKIKNIELRGGYSACLYLVNVDHAIVENCTIGYGAVKGVQIQQDSTPDSSTYIDIVNCTISSGFNGTYDHEDINLNDGITLYQGAEHCNVTNCTISNWGHCGVGLTATSTGNGVKYNTISDNVIIGANVSYMRGFSVSGPDTKTQYNEIVRNCILNTTVRNQINGDHNIFAYNLIDTISNSPCYSYGTAQGIELQGYGSNVCHDNKIANNTILNCDEAGIRLRTDANNKEDNIISNNIVYNCGLDSKDSLDNYGIVVDNASDILNNTFENNCVYKSGIANVIYYRGTAMSVSTWNTSDSNGDTIDGNIQSDPLLSGFRLSHNSPCINAGTTISGFHETVLDIDKQPILGTPDIGCDERKALWWDGRRWHMQRMYALASTPAPPSQAGYMTFMDGAGINYKDTGGITFQDL